MKKIFLSTSILFILLSSILIYQNITFADKKLHVVFCDVGQGDAIFIRTPNGSDILIDGGPDESVLSCLAKHMPFWDRTIEIMILTHPHADHLTGLISVIKRYNVLSFATEKISNKTLSFNYLVELIKSKNIKTNYVYQSDRFRLGGGVILEIVGPSKEFLDETSPEGLIGESAEFGSVETLVKYRKFSALLTGDSQASELQQAISSKRYAISNLSVLQVPHHGSRFGLTAEILNILKPKIAAISVGAKNKYGHPTQFILDLLNQFGIKTLRTDLSANAMHQALQAGQNGDIEIISDGNLWKVK